MKTAIIDYYSQIRATYWFTPALMAIASILLSFLTLQMDHLLDFAWLKEMGWTYPYKPGGAREILTTIATSMITVAGVTFSMTIVAVSFAASQIGPRLTANFMRDKPNQITLGTFIATFLFCLMILRSISSPTSENGEITAFIPQISLLFATLLALCSIAVLIYFIHHIPKSINMANVIARVGYDLTQQVERLFPDGIGYEPSRISREIPQKYHQHQRMVLSSGEGYIRVLDGNALIKLAQKHHFIFILHVRPGDFVTRQSHMVEIFSCHTIDEAIESEILQTFALGYQRNQEQDILFLTDEMVEIIARALSPGVNEPFTAMTCMDWLQLMLEKASKSTEPSLYRFDDGNHLRLLVNPIRFHELCELVFSRILGYVCRDRNASMHMMHMIFELHRNIKHQEHKAVLEAYATALNEAVKEGLPIAQDRRAVNEQYKACFQPELRM